MNLTITLFTGADLSRYIRPFEEAVRAYGNKRIKNNTFTITIGDKYGRGRSGNISPHAPALKVGYPSKHDEVDIFISKKGSANGGSLDTNTSKDQAKRLNKEIKIAISFAEKNYDDLLKLWNAVNDNVAISMVEKLIKNNPEFEFTYSTI